MPFDNIKPQKFMLDDNTAIVRHNITTLPLPKDKRKRRRIKRRLRQSKEFLKQLREGVTIYGKRAKSDWQRV